MTKVLSEIIEIIESGSRPKGGVNRVGDVPSLGAEHLDRNGSFDFTNVKNVSLDFYNSINSGKIEERDILIVKDGATTGKVSYVGTDFPFKKAAINEHVFRIKINCNLAHPKYIYYYLASKNGNRQIMSDFHGATVGGISKRFSDKVKIPLPPLPEQQRIAAILDHADAIRRKNQEILEKYDLLAQSVFLEMFGDVIMNHKSWPKKPLGQLVKIRRGASPRPISDFLGGTVPWIKIGDGTSGSDIYIEDTREAVTEEGARRSVVLEPGTLIFANCGVSLGFARILKIRGCIHDGWLCFEEIDDTILNKIFLLKLLNSISNYFRNSAPEGTQPNLNTSIMKGFEIPVPPIDLQDKFSGIIMSIIKQKELTQKSIEKSEGLFQSLLQRAFKGNL
ncbi:MAG: restriction endonuclease subunit S [Bacteroidales bacterium]|nr:restriction endonuclease subunit S [Bacteroidales bacterium]